MLDKAVMTDSDDSEKAISRNGIQVIARAAAVLRALKDDPTGLSLGQIAERVALPRSTVQRIVAALQDERLVISSNQGSGIRLGPELHALARHALQDALHLQSSGVVLLHQFRFIDFLRQYSVNSCIGDAQIQIFIR